MPRFAAVFTTCLALGCTSATLPPADAGTTSGGDDSTGPPPATSVDAADESTGDVPAVPIPDPFKLDRNNIKLLPFRVRFNKLQALVGLPAADPTFDVLRARRYELGDYDYASGVNPDLTWNAARISVWLAAMLPICRSPQMHARFPVFPDSLAALISAAYGTTAGPDQLADYEDLLGDASLDEPTRYDTICASVLTALEFVAQ